MIQDPIDVFSEWLDVTADLQVRANKKFKNSQDFDENKRSAIHEAERENDDYEGGDADDHDINEYDEDD